MFQLVALAQKQEGAVDTPSILIDEKVLPVKLASDMITLTATEFTDGWDLAGEETKVT